MTIDQKLHKHFVARRASVLREISDEFGGVSVSFPRADQGSNVVKIKGPSECVEGARKRLLEMVDDLVCPVHHGLMRLRNETVKRADFK